MLNIKAAVDGATAAGIEYADSIGDIIRYSDEARRQPILEAATARLRETLGQAVHLLRAAGGDEHDARTYMDSASLAFSDRIVEILEQ